MKDRSEAKLTFALLFIAAKVTEEMHSNAEKKSPHYFQIITLDGRVRHKSNVDSCFASQTRAFGAFVFVHRCRDKTRQDKTANTTQHSTSITSCTHFLPSR